jgi:hypothetical protein
MKIIAKTSEDSLLVECTRNELARVMGHYSESSLPVSQQTRQRVEFKIGDEVQVNESYLDIRTLAATNSEVANASKTLRKTLDAIDRLMVRFEPIATAVKSKLPKDS